VGVLIDGWICGHKFTQISRQIAKSSVRELVILFVYMWFCCVICCVQNDKKARSSL